MKNLLHVLPSLILSSALISSCVPLKIDTPAPTPAPACTSVVPEVAACSPIDYSSVSTITVSGEAKFQKRSIIRSGNSLFLSGNADLIELPIRFAEVQVLNSSGSLVQCGVTDGTGQLRAFNGSSALTIPTTSGSYVVKVISRTNTTFPSSGASFTTNASVKKDICTNSHHSISKTFTSMGTNVTIPTNDLLATAKENDDVSIPGAAFNILNNLITTYEYLSSSVGTTQNLSCLNPKLDMYWQAGFNPAQYIYPNVSPADVDNVSFYLRGYNELYINGGKLGDVRKADTDHFDDAVVIHEIGHHIESACGKADSPGGAHNGLFRIDPRLAWSEGWGNFLGAHVIRNNFDKIYNNSSAVRTALSGVAINNSTDWNFYLDTSGYAGDAFVTTPRELIRFEMIRDGTDPERVATNYLGYDYHYDKVDGTANPGEGHFREVSIARSLFKISNTCDPATRCVAETTDPSPTTYFSEVWKSFVDLGQGSFPFRSSVRFYERFKAVLAPNPLPAEVTTILTNEAQQPHGDAVYTSTDLNWPSYGIKLVPQSTECKIQFHPRKEPAKAYIQGLDDERSDPRYSNHFYYVDFNTINANTITLSATHLAGSNVDLDLALMPEAYRYPESPCINYNSSYICTAYTKVPDSNSQFIRYSRTNSTATSQTESLVNLATLPKTARYVLNLRAYTAGSAITVSNSTVYEYTLTTNNAGEYLCPDNSNY
ncbi:hypothetical protein [Pseudobdellovibrio exovorus]|uniref:Lipoprotein n=1 Tax=Pseudobdellovibrio exovorus JSS TaxID=1184267 RepID=M4VES0_9BACT|nr:hypothetical protein [Pseudobdellovibrio exovorus]AGH96526.1 hypothetical protein A11Q_2310 [Pseudobdellovibrio exovorus JSS]